MNVRDSLVRKAVQGSEGGGAGPGVSTVGA